MNYIIEVCYGDRNEWSDEVKYYNDALTHALTMSLVDGVSETRVWFDEELIDTCVDGHIVEEEDNEREEYDDTCDLFDEVGYDPYTGGYDADL